jgi:stage II sporulation protein D
VAEQFEKFISASAAPFQMEAALATPMAGENSHTGEFRHAEVRLVPQGLRVLIAVGLESYVAGVLAGEASTLRSPAALEAMAVVARTWALRWQGRHRAAGFDFCSLTHCQVFHLPPQSRNSGRSEISRAVFATRGKVLKYHGQLIDPYFSADCGGVTESAAEIWSDQAAPYLVSFADPYCAGSDHSSWQRSVPLVAVDAVLRQDLKAHFLGPLRDIRIEERDASGRVRRLRLEGQSSFLVNADEFRLALNRRLGWATLKSNLYTLERQGDSLLFTGRGLGHGVGLCQAGAEQMGRTGMGFDKILATYFPGARVSEAEAVALNDPVLSSEHFELVFPDEQQPLANETLQALETSRAELARRVEMPNAKIRVETFATTPDFIRASNQPGWAAASTDGVSILLQPLTTLRRKNILDPTLRHELTHLAVHRLRSPQIPRWFEEGSVLYLTVEQVKSDPQFDFGGRSLEECVSKPRSEAEMKAAYALALTRVRTLAHRRGEPALWEILEHPSQRDLHWLKDQK